MARRNKIIPDFNIERERFSNFVVDLRQQEKKATQEVQQEIKTAEKKIKKNWDANLNNLSRNFNVFKPNLLLAARKQGVKFSWPARWTLTARRKTGIFGRSAAATAREQETKTFSWLKNLLRPKRPESPWQKFVLSQEKILSAPLNFAKRKKQIQPAQKTEVNKTPVLDQDREVHNDQTAAISLPRALGRFALALIIIILIFQALSYWRLFDINSFISRVSGHSLTAVNSLVAGANSAAALNFRQADTGFQSASANFLAAANDLNKINGGLLALAALSNNPKIKLAAESQKFLAAGQSAAALGHDLVAATDSLFNGDKNNFPATLDNFLASGHKAVSDAQSLEQAVSQINPDNLPAAYRAQFIALRQQAKLLALNLANFVSLGDNFKEVLGLSRDKRYLLVFQNNSELRASGGFLGSYALVDLSEGKIKNLEVPGGGSYDTEGGMTVRVAAPQPLWLVNPLWHFWDANWWPDWPKTAQNLMWFYGKSGGPSVDGVISVTPTVVERLLQITGPIDMQADYGLTITSDNFWDTIQRVTEQPNLAKTDPAAVVGIPAPQANKPKKIIGDLMAKILAVLPQKLNQNSLVNILQQFEEDMSEKQILLYFSDPKLEAAAASHNWAGAISPADKDYLMVVNTNIAGQKSDRLIVESVAATSTVSTSGVVINTVTITRTHTGVKNAPLTGVRNVDWMRVYVPAGSVLLSASGFTAPDPKYLQNQPDPSWDKSPLLDAENSAAIDPTTGTKTYLDSGKTVFANWSMVDPGQTTVITLKYLLPFNFLTPPAQSASWLTRLNDWLNPTAAEFRPYSLVLQKQPGAAADAFSSRLLLPPDWQVIWRYPDNLHGVNGWNITMTADSDKYWSVLLEKK